MSEPIEFGPVDMETKCYGCYEVMASTMIRAVACEVVLRLCYECTRLIAPGKHLEVQEPRRCGVCGSMTNNHDAVAHRSFREALGYAG